MWAVKTDGLAFLCMFAALISLGVWPSLWRWSTMRVERQHRGASAQRLRSCLLELQSMDFALGVVLPCLVLGVALGETGPDSPNISQQRLAGGRVLLAIGSGALIALGNQLMATACNLAGLSTSMFLTGGTGPVSYTHLTLPTKRIV